MENHGVRYETRYRVMRERILAMKALWTQEEASFHGEFVNFDPVWSWPKPTQRPTHQSFLGGESDHTLRRVVEYCDGWIPRTYTGFTPKNAVERWRMAGQKQRDPRSLSISVFSAPADKEVLAEYREAGIDEALLAVPDVSRDKILQLLDLYVPLTGP
jgi:alkanesulfonate monooxygenase SsuD/methylene tetrahydromethanopterin reductase-like flavin-dependent oxidoreductase (luciferase family)